MRIAILTVVWMGCQLTLWGQSNLNVSLIAQYHRGDVRYSGSWCYAAPDGTEYALLGAKTGTAVYRILDDSVEELAFIPGPVTNWREITTLGQHAYVVTDVQGSGHGMQVIDLSTLPDTATLVANYTATFTMGHIIQRDIFDEAPYVYVCGTTATEGVHILDIGNPAQPVEIGLYDPGYYIHDCHVRGNTMYAAAFYAGTIDIVDISDKSQPLLIARISISDGYTHSASTTADGRYLFVAAERDGLPARIFNVEDPYDAYEVADYTASQLSLVHNPYIAGNYAYVSHNTEGLRVVDISDPEFPVEVGYFDTYAGAGGGFFGLWSACPYLPSGRIIGGNREDGLYVWSFNGAQAGRIYLYARDANTGEPLPAASAIASLSSDTIYANLEGLIKTGGLPGTFTWEIAAPNYEPAFFSAEITAGNSDTVTVFMHPLTVATNESQRPSQVLKVAPNPAQDELQLFLESHQQISLLELRSTTGALICRWNSPSSPISTANVSPGLYYLTAYDTSGNYIAATPLLISN